MKPFSLLQLDSEWSVFREKQYLLACNVEAEIQSIKGFNDEVINIKWKNILKDQ